MRIVLVALALLLGACEGSFVSAGDRWRAPRIDEAYAARDACLARNATSESASIEDVAAAARALARACAPETEKLVQTANRDGDSKVATNIRENSRFRAMGYVLKARGQLIFE